MTLCPRCQSENREDRRFCSKCGAPLSIVCASCGFSNDPGDQFCGGCAQPLRAVTVVPLKLQVPETYTPKHLAENILTSRAALEGERKQVTVLFADLKGSMELLADRDPEAARNLLDPVLELMTDAVRRYEGTVNQVMGDGIMALFGAPIAHEDHAVRASYAALSMQQSARRYAERVRRQHGITVRIRVGLNSGEVVVRAIGSDLHMDYTAVGQTTHLAARMEQLADPGSILLTRETLALAEGFIQVTPLGPMAVKGLPGPIDVYELSGVSATRSRLHATASRGLSRFVGRDAEMEQLHRALGHARHGRGQVVAIVGEPGVGKSRFVLELTHSHRVEGWLVLESSSVSYGKATSYLPVIDLLKTYFRIGERDTYREIREKVTGKVLTLDRLLEPLLSALLALLDVPVEDSQWSSLDPVQRRQRTLDAVKRLVLREAQAQPLLLVFEDLHWIDSETQALLDSLVESLPSMQLLLLVNYRPEYRHLWGSKTYYDQLRLDTLPSESIEQMLDSILGSDPSLQPLKALLAERTGGNPLFLEESVRALVETKSLLGDRTAYRLAQPVETVQVPATVQAILASRIDRLPPEQKRLLETAAVVGKDFQLAVLEAVADESTEMLRRGLDHLQAAEFLYETTLFPDLEYTFKHALTHEVTFAAMLHERRRTLHARLVGAIETLYADRPGEQIERLAYHALRGEVWEKAVVKLQEAGARAAARSAARQSVAFYEQGLGALVHLPPSSERAAMEIDLNLRLRHALFPLGELRRLREVVEKTAALAGEMGDRVRLGRATAAQAHSLWAAGQAEPAILAARRAVITAEEVADSDGLFGAGFCLGQAYHLHGDFHQCMETLRLNAEQARVEFERPRLDLLRFRSVVSFVWLAFALAELGEFSPAIAAGEEAVARSEQHDTPYGLFHGCMGLGTVLLIKGEVDRALATLLRAQSVAEATDLPLMANAVQALVGHAYLHANRVEEACFILERANAYTESIDFMAFYPFGLTYLSGAYLRQGDVDKAQALAERAAELTLRYRQHGYHAWALLMLGEVASHRVQVDEATARTRYRESLAMANERGMRPLVAHCHRGLGKLDRRTGKREQAREHLTTATTMYRDMGMTYWSERAEAEMRELG
jgi:class 3 adenylate cyclase/tetratricopeptide (TPR) repeat protein